MSEPPSSAEGDVTRLLAAWRQGRPGALDALLPLVYDPLRRLARRQLHRLQPGATLNTTALLHEAYLKLVDRSRADYRDRGRFFAVASKVMRHILVDEARRRAAAKRDPEAGGHADPGPAGGEDRLLEVLAVDEALGRLVELRFFGGLSVEETAEAMEISPRTVKRDWQKARAFLHLSLSGTEAS